MSARTISRLFVLVFLAAAVLFSVTTFKRIPHPIIVHINQQWSIVLVGESSKERIIFHSADFTLEKTDAGNLWLQGQGDINWKPHNIRVSEDRITINDKDIAKSRQGDHVTLLLYPDGRLTKGRLDLSGRPDNLEASSPN